MTQTAQALSCPDIRQIHFEVDPLLRCDNCDGDGILRDEHHNPPVDDCPCCLGGGQVEEPGGCYLHRVVRQMAPVEDHELVEKLIACLASVLTERESDQGELDLTLRYQIARLLLPSPSHPYHSAIRTHDISLDDNGDYRRA